jgi:hypothetical protein
MRLVVGRSPTEDEARILAAALARYGQKFAAAEMKADELVAKGGQPTEGSATAELAAYTLICSTVLNLDEAITRQ